ncbi:hypothetical protein BSR03_17290 [Serratia proteamaculans]|jgi:predicted DNA-binding transcriptional regulator AlpA|uniref:helix-turn-helix transcriptional regulator n=1 Tax=Serratia proteamaculans TaxID=28151 RepID=UPI0010207EF2|nr:helix-turn-helix domain-containing protein [Serratia proteamaculans]RYM60198.1 hypothetical protein BSR03_17290 [Serratia proteamaculans]
MIERYLSTDEVCDIIKRTKPTLWAWIKAGDFPPANRTKSGKVIGWPPSVVEKWQAQCKK